MLYERWRQIAREHRNELALREVRRAEQWTFRQLAELTENIEPAKSPVAFPTGLSVEFIFAVLRAWRAGQSVCPLEAGQKPFAISEPPQTIAHLKTTSATTGDSRLVALTAPQLQADADNIVETMGLRSDWPNLGVISLAHSYGFSNLVTPLLLHGIPLVLLDAPLPEAVRSAAASMGEITLPAVPALWRAWHEADAIPGNVRLAISAGAPLPLPLEQIVFERHGLKLHNFYGASECGGIAYDTTAAPRKDAALIGAPLRNVNLSTTEEGCLEVRGAAVAETYWPEPNPNLGQGCYRTTDLVELSEGQVFLRGRVNDLINVAGRKISPEAIEKVLLVHPLVRDCLVFGAPSHDAGRAEMIVACVVSRSPVTGETLKQHLLSHLAGWQVPRDWWFVDSLAVNQRGKLSRADWRKKYLVRSSS